MRNFILLIRRFWNTILFFLLLVIGVTLIANNKSMQGQTIVSSSNRIVGYLYQKQNDVVHYFQLKKMNDSLLLDHSYLMAELAVMYATDTFQDYLAYVPDTIVPIIPIQYDTSFFANVEGADSLILTPIQQEKVAVTYAEYEFIPVRVIKNSISQSNINYITLNRGTQAGIEVGMPVVTTRGIVGRVTNVSQNFATVASVLSNRLVHAKLETGQLEFIRWEGLDPDIVVMKNLPLLDSIPIGTKVYTGYSYFPTNLLIGEVISIRTIERTNAQEANIKLSTNFRDLQYAYVIKNYKEAEQSHLEQETEAQ